MKMNVVIKSLAIFIAAAVAMRVCADTVDVSVQVKDQDARPVEDVKLGSESGDKSISGEGGKAKLAVKKRALSTRFSARKEGYYETQTAGFPMPMSPNVDLSKAVEIVIKQIKSPIPMYVKNLTAGLGGPLKLPSYDGNSYGYDLVIGDWVAPQGKGNVSDFIFMFEGNTGRVINLEEWEKKFSITFSNKHDGIIAWEGTSEAGRKYGSELVSDYEAPKEGYQDTWVQRTWKEKGGYHQTTSNIDRNFYFRVRTKVDEKGNIISAHYGKIYGDFMSFIYYLNPTPNDRNVEFDPKRNLLPDGNVQRP
jgi:hypothetical protein